jgi:hypothetical protein
MFLGDYDDDWGSHKSSKDASGILSEISKIKNKGLSATLQEVKKLKELELELTKIQKECSHYWFVILLFHRHRKFCKWCDKEDYEYKHPF